MSMIIDCISDLHGFYPKLEGGDLLIIAGDMTASDKIREWAEFFAWLKLQSYGKKIIIAGNHDCFFESGFPKNQTEADSLKEVQEWLVKQNEMDTPDFEYLCDSGTEFQGFKIWGSPWTKKFHGQDPNAMAFGLVTDTQMMERWALIPEDIDILITHSPLYGQLDKTWKNHQVGCCQLERVVKRIRPKLHIFGHIHESYGQEERDGIIYVNASQVDKRCKHTNKPVRILLQKE